MNTKTKKTIQRQQNIITYFVQNIIRITISCFHFLPATMQQNDTPEIAWKDSEAKRHLYDAIVNGEVTDDIGPALVYGMRTEYQVFKYENFRNNLRTLPKNLLEWLVVVCLEKECTCAR